MVRQVRVSYVLFIAGLLLTGCVDRTELNELGITTATGIDGHKGDWINTYQIIIPSAMTTGSGGSSTGASQSAVHTFSTHGKTLRETVTKSSLEYPRKLYFAAEASSRNDQVANSGRMESLTAKEYRPYWYWK